MVRQSGRVEGYSKLKYFARVASGVRYSKFKAMLDCCHEKSGRSRVAMSFDILLSAALFGAGYYDYAIFGFYDIDYRHRATYITRAKNARLINMLNDETFARTFDMKSVQARRLLPYFKRGVLFVAEANEESLRDFMADKEVVFAKPEDGVSGRGIERLRISDFDSVADMLNYIKQPEKKFGLLEQAIVQHPDLSRLYPLAINTQRVVTLMDSAGEVHVVYATQKLGDKGKFVDNLENDGMCVPINPVDGKLVGLAHTSRLEVLERHPYSGIVFDGYQLPYVQQTFELVKAAAKAVPEMRFLGWDIAITPDGPVVVEANDWPGYDFWQLPEQTPNRIGLVPVYKKLVPGF
ncbi:MAG: hypothetical protein LBC29_04175 [Propionibacteriaceae bacterium]|nr:hypothetical protein [Propionibacteriaceae bacterium]